MTGVSTSDFVAEINRIMGLPKPNDRLAAALSYQSHLSAGSSLAPYALFVFGQVYLRCGQPRLVREIVLDLLSQFPDRDDAADYALRLSQEPLILHDMIDERFVENLQAAARRQVLRNPAHVAATAAVLVYLIKARHAAAASRLTRRFLAHCPPDVLAGDVIAQRIALYDPGFGSKDPLWCAPPAGGSVVWEAQAPAGSQDTVILFSGDDRYWRAFGPGILKSLIIHAPDMPAHVHIVNPSPATVEEMRAITQLGQRRLGFTYETLPATDQASGIAANQLKTYYACARFLALPEILPRYGRPIFVLDMDIRLRRPLHRLLAQLRGADVAMVTDPGKSPWHCAVACMTWFAPTPQGQSYANYATRYLRALFARGSAYWTADQVVLDIANARLAQEGGRLTEISFVEARRHVAFAGQFIGEMSITEKVAHLDSIA